MNPPYGGSTDIAAKSNFPMEFRSSETSDLFMVLIMYRLKADGRAAVIVPDGFLFGVDGAKLAIKAKMLRDFNLHTIIRLPGSIFSPYTSIATNVLFFNNEKQRTVLTTTRLKKHGSIEWICRKDINTSLKLSQ